MESEPEPGPPRATGAKRLLLAAAGLVCVGLAYLGAILPGLPTTPWVLAASYFFSKSSPRLERWLKRSPVFGRLGDKVSRWVLVEVEGGINRLVKVWVISTVLAYC